jgi:hypothetical protein
LLLYQRPRFCLRETDAAVLPDRDVWKENPRKLPRRQVETTPNELLTSIKVTFEGSLF